VEDVPIGHVTNGVHRWTWMSAGVQRMLDEELGAGWATRSREPEFWDRVLTLDDERVWHTHLGLKRAASDFLREQARRRWRELWTHPSHLAAAGPLLDPDVLTLGFARRFATYKRADLLLRDEERLFALLTDTKRPVQIVFAGKAHPADDDGKRILQRIHQLACDARTEGRVAFIEDYEMHSARALFCGVDVWLNVPRVPMEASGTSGMKAALNLVPQLGTHDGWWAEGYNGSNGWLIPGAPEIGDADAMDWDHLFRLLEQEVVPTYYERDARDVPVEWVERMKTALWIAGRDFTTERMLIDYTDGYYGPALRSESAGDRPPSA
jgi:starch phosphorylase